MTALWDLRLRGQRYEAAIVDVQRPSSRRPSSSPVKTPTKGSAGKRGAAGGGVPECPPGCRYTAVVSPFNSSPSFLHVVTPGVLQPVFFGDIRIGDFLRPGQAVRQWSAETWLGHGNALDADLDIDQTGGTEMFDGTRIPVSVLDAGRGAFLGVTVLCSLLPSTGPSRVTTRTS